MDIPGFADRILDILSDESRCDVREGHRRQQIQNLFRKKFPALHEITINGLVEELYSAVYQGLNHEE